MALKKLSLEYVRYDIVLLFLAFALLNIEDVPTALLIVPSTLLFAGAYLLLVRSRFKQLDNLFWFYLQAYVLSFSLWNPNPLESQLYLVLFLFEQSASLSI